MDTDFNLFRTAKNIVSNIVLFAINILISLWYTPYLIRNIGSELFGFVPLSTSLISFLGIFTSALNISTGRQITIELEKGMREDANQVFNTTLIGTLLMVSATLPLGAALVLLAPVLFNIPPGQERPVQWLFLGVMASFYIAMLQVNYKVATFARDRFDLRNVVNLLARIGQIVVVVSLFIIDRPNIVYVGIGIFAGSLLGFIGDFTLWKMLLPALSIRLRSFRKEKLKSLFQIGSWTLVYQIGFLLFLNADMFIANRTLTLSVAGMYGALLVIPKNLRILSKTIGDVWGPSILMRYSQGDYPGMDAIIKLSVKLIGLFMALPVGLVCGFSRPFLRLWLGPEFEIMTPVLILMVFHLASTLIIAPFFNVQISLNRLRTPALAAFFFGAANVVFSILLAGPLGATGIALATAATYLAFYSVFTPLYTAYIMDLPRHHYLTRLPPIYAAGTGVAALAYLSTAFFTIDSLLKIVLVGGILSVVYLFGIYQWGLAQGEKQALIRMLRKAVPSGPRSPETLP